MTPPPPAPAGEKGRQRAAEILAAARALLVEEGYAALTTRKVAQRVGIRLSNVQYYYPTKAELVRALFEQVVAAGTGALRQRMAAERLTPRQAMLLSLDNFLRSHHDLAEQRFLRELWALAAHDGEVAKVMDDFYLRWVEMTTRSLLLVNPRLGRRRAEKRALLIISLVDGLSLFHGAVGLPHRAVKGIGREVREVVLALAGVSVARSGG